MINKFKDNTIFSLRLLFLTTLVLVSQFAFTSSFANEHTMTREELHQIHAGIRKLSNVTNDARKYAISRFEARSDTIKDGAKRFAKLQQDAKDRLESTRKRLKDVTSKRKKGVKKLVSNCSK